MTNQTLSSLIAEHQTPFYVFELSKVTERIQYLRSKLPQGIELCYAVKANTFITKHLNNYVDWLEICSLGEYNICNQLNLTKSKYVISGVNKDPALINKIIKMANSIGYITIESINQFNELYEAAKKARIRLPLILRLTSGNQFGLDTNDIYKLISSYKADAHIQFLGIQYYSGTQKTSIKKLRRELTIIDDLIQDIQNTLSFKIQKLEFGPGLPVPYFEDDTFDEDFFLDELSSMLTSLNFNGTIALEIGRSIAAYCGTYFTRIIDTKESNGSFYAIADGGMHQLVYYGQSMAMKHPYMSIFPDRKDTDIKSWNICGSLCTSNDILIKNYPISDLKIGDILAFKNAGAYCVTEGISLFLSRDIPAVFLLENNQVTLVRNQIQASTLNTPIFYNNRRSL